MELEKESRVDKETKSKQDAFLKIFSDGAQIKAAALGARISRRQVQRWVADDKFGFTAKYDAAKEDFKDHLLGMAMTRLESQPTNTLLLLAMLNAYIPEKFKPTTGSSEDVAKDTIRELRTLAKTAFAAKPAEKEQMAERSAMEQAEEIILQKKGTNGN
jgi:hypothetical protein|tara:strand:- start:1465 stop:1941 length:477 start_codon:yes stop_codon:yes gene_type:complete